jgi:Protein of unknown function (DUF1549)/Protein of unknown function (DUF1553)
MKDIRYKSLRFQGDNLMGSDAMERGVPSPCVVIAALILDLFTAGGLSAAEPLHRKIDRAIEAKLDGESAALATDSEYLRRAYLDLSGMIPTSSEARAFLDDPSPYKRQRLIDRLLAGPEYARRMQDVFDVMLMERRNDVHVPAAQWQAFLRSAFAENVPYNRLVGQVLSADGTDPKTRGAAKFYLDRLAEPNSLTRDIGRMFLGRDLQCAQCHDHPLVDDYKQAHYYGLYAFLNRTTLFDGGKNGSVLAEKADGAVTFASVFKKKVSHQTGPRILDGPAVVEPAVPKGAEYLVAPEKQNKVRPIPRYSRRAELAPMLTSGAVPEFNRNIVNRLWAMMMGRGLVHPVDMHHADNPPSDGELLDLLAREFVAMGYDVKAFLRELAFTRAYQRSSEPPPGATASAEGTATSNLLVFPLKPLTPEQLAWSVMQGLGLVAAAKVQAEEGLHGRDPKLRAIFQTDAKRRSLRASMIEEAIHAKLQSGVTPFVRQFAASAGQPQDATEPTVHQALFLSNGGTVQAWLAPSTDKLIGRLAAITDNTCIVEELYLSLYSRRPTDDERAESARYLVERGKERAPALQEMAWALLASTEFRFNH